MKTIVLQQKIVAELQPGEKLLWSGHPKTGLDIQRVDFCIAPLGLLLFGYALRWMWRVQAAGFHPAIFLGVPFLLMGLYLAVGRFLYVAQQRAHTAYNITSERVLIRSGIFRKQVTSFDLKSLPALTLVEKPDGTGTISLGAIYSRYAALARVGWPGVPQTPQLARIPNARQVYERLVKLQRGVAV
ncbi:PH domain-containing protein [Hymenobacter monticola]|uniref:PH domain-containing protein n=1 Tax=Hymenobacter monticola TaxID=1705399 RepID=A0ABY4BD73_9BACT|nr:PH domain-containing protein [Hymenobacter monticola]UOE36834.1 PH domain-containing protein [Hymenobacter monticola]